MGERAVAYRRINDIPDDWGTAVNVQQMVYGNHGPTSEQARRCARPGGRPRGTRGPSPHRRAGPQRGTG
jgi:hypothetical protein